ncbi:sensor histidine kinase [Micromonospora mirobrigensis]|uniref:Anti-sigma regulatory factor (Ser/Thr protein kinase) n=1 Tax=Micromonospora mirobrigensis TaxID=262898 RepID=A0A1C4W4K3_9ACTN|nr:sensor histidine kinase [Micromonospora mirobrigensis]SCE91166.1 Anti-sigma regulatory factor (Ser/Thr protein kinase) [Micromonospora mirobrigensis]
MSARTAANGLIHEGLLYTNTTDLLAGTVSFVEDGLRRDEPVMVAAPARTREPLRAALGTAADRVGWADMTQAGRNPGRIIPWVLQAFADRHPEQRVRIIGEPIWAGRTAHEYRACAQHEAMINAAFAARPMSILCPYDAVGLSAGALAEARCTHPVLVDRAGRRPSGGYAPDDVVARHNRPLPDPTGPVATLDYRLDTLAQVRRFVTGHAAGAGLDPDRTDDLLIAVTELAANSVAHGGGSGGLRVWSTDEHLVCEIRDAGRLTDPLAGRLAPGHDGVGGRGLVIVHALCDLVLVHTAPAGTTVRLHVRLGTAVG